LEAAALRRAPGRPRVERASTARTRRGPWPRYARTQPTLGARREAAGSNEEPTLLAAGRAIRA